jgi:hypothetical protein
MLQATVHHQGQRLFVQATKLVLLTLGTRLIMLEIMRLVRNHFYAKLSYKIIDLVPDERAVMEYRRIDPEPRGEIPSWLDEYWHSRISISEVSSSISNRRRGSFHRMLIPVVCLTLSISATHKWALMIYGNSTSRAARYITVGYSR